MKFTGSRGQRIASLALGGFLVVVQLIDLPQVPRPVNRHTFGYDLAWNAIFAAGVWLLLYGLGVVGRKKSAPPT
jgi:hypothetical protein